MPCIRMLRLDRLFAYVLVLLGWFVAHDDSIPALLYLLFVGTLISLPPKDLFERCAQMPIDDIAWRTFLKRYNTEVEGTIRRIIGYPPHGRYCSHFDDIMQRFYERLLDNDRRALRALRGKEEAQARAYLRTIAAGVAYKLIAREQRQHAALDHFPDERDENLHPPQSLMRDPESLSEEAILLWETIQGGMQAILRGRNKHRNMLIFKLAVMDGFTPKEIFLIAGLHMKSCHAIEELISRIRRKLHDYLLKQ